MELTNRLPSSLLEENLANFASLLRNEGLAVGTPELIDSLQALQLVGVSRRAIFKAALQATMAKGKKEQEVFDKLFDLYFVPAAVHRERIAKAAADKKRSDKQLAKAQAELNFKGEALHLTPGELDQYTLLSEAQRGKLLDFMHKTETGVNVEPRFRPLLETVVKSHLRYCRDRETSKTDSFASATAPADGAGAGNGPADLADVDIVAMGSAELAAAEELMQKLSRRLAAQILRRRRSGPRSGVLDLRRSLRDNMRYGGVVFNLRHKPKRRSKQQVMLLCDVSASMKRYSSFVIHFLQGLRETVRSLSCFSFSDSLEELTPELRGRVDLQALLDRLVLQSKTWGGGTNLGRSLEILQERYPGVLNARTTVLVVSDTRTVALDYALKQLQKCKEKARRLIWLNPLPPERWPDHRSVETISGLVEMWPCSTIAQLEAVLEERF